MKRLIAILTMAVGCAAFSATGPTVSTGSVQPGEFNSSFAKCDAYAKANHLPFVTIVGLKDCDYCDAFAAAISGTGFKEFLKKIDNRIVLCYKHLDATGYGFGDNPKDPTDPVLITGDDNKAAVRFVCYTAEGRLFSRWGSRPNIGAYLLSEDGLSFKTNFNGRMEMMLSTKSDTLLGRFTDSLEICFADFWWPESTDVGMFVTGETVGNRLEAEPTTAVVKVPVGRDEKLRGLAMTNYVAAVSADGAVATTNRVTWAVGDGRAYADVQMSAFAAKFRVGDSIRLVLLDKKYRACATNSIALVAAREMSVTNPLFVGAKTADELAYSDFTLDYTTVTAKVAKVRATGGSAYTLAFYSGVLWCPYCKGIEETLINDTSFKSFLDASHVQLALFDQALSPTDAYPGNAHLLGYGAGLEHFVGVTEHQMVSGADYLSRHGLSEDDPVAQAVHARSVQYSFTDWKTPGSTSVRMSTPTMLLIGPTNQVLGRLSLWRDRSFILSKDDKNYSPIENIGRLKDLLLLANRADESSDYAALTKLEHAIGGGSSVPLQINDTKEFYKLGNLACGEVTITVTNETPYAVTLAYLRDGKTVTNGTGRLTFEVTEADLAAESRVLQVSAALSSTTAYFVKAVTNDTTVVPTPTGLRTTAFEAKFASSLTLIPAQEPTTWSSADGRARIRLVEGTLYRLTGVDDQALGTGLRKSALGDDVYEAVASGDFDIGLSDGTLTARLWLTGTVAFAQAAVSVDEYCEGGKSRVVTFPVVRTGGNCGKAAVTVNVVSCEGYETAVSTGRIDAFQSQTLTWEDGEVQTNYFSLTVYDNSEKDGDLVFPFLLSAAEGNQATVSGGSLMVTLTDDDIYNEPGHLAITSAGSGFSGVRSIVAKGGEKVTFEVTRENGRLGNASAHLVLSTSSGITVTSDPIFWASGSANIVKRIEMTIPVLGEAGIVTVRLVSDTAEVTVDAAQESVKVQVPAAIAPEFAQVSITATVCQGFAYAQTVEIRTANGGEPGFVATTGKLPYGMTATLVDGALVISGTPTVPGSYTAFFRAKETKDDVAIYGTTLAVNLEIPSVESVAEKSENPALGETFTCADIPVFDVPDVGKAHLGGILTVSASSLGRLSAKYRTANGTYAFAGDGWTGLSKTDELSGELVRVGEEDVLAVSVAADGVMSVSFVDPETERTVTGEQSIFRWNAANPATAWEGRFVVQLPQETVAYADGPTNSTGTGYLTLKMTGAAIRSGMMTYAGLLPNGRTISGCATLLARGEDAAWLPWLSAETEGLARYAVSGVLGIGSDGKILAPAGTAPLWISRADSALEKTVEFGVYGDRYDRTHIYEFFLADYQAGLEPFGFTVDPGKKFPGSITDGAFAGMPSVPMTVTAAGKPSIVGANPYRLKVSFGSGTGVVSGSFLMRLGAKDVPVRFKGVVLPGWGECGACSEDVIERPFMSGSCWFTDQFEGSNFKNGCAITINRIPSSME